MKTYSYIFHKSSAQIFPYLLPPQWEIIFFPSHKNTKNINTFVPQDSHINIRLETYKHNKIQGPSDLYCKPCSWRSGLQFKNPETPRPKDCSVSHCTGFNFGVMFCLVGPTVRPTMKRERSRCWCLHACNSLASKLPRKKYTSAKAVKVILIAPQQETTVNIKDLWRSLGNMGVVVSFRS